MPSKLIHRHRNQLGLVHISEFIKCVSDVFLIHVTAGLSIYWQDMKSGPVKRFCSGPVRSGAEGTRDCPIHRDIIAAWGAVSLSGVTRSKWNGLHPGPLWAAFRGLLLRSQSYRVTEVMTSSLVLQRSHPSRVAICVHLPSWLDGWTRSALCGR